MKRIYGKSPLEFRCFGVRGGFFGPTITRSANCWSESAMMWPAMVVDSIASIHMLAASVIVLPYAVSSLGLVRGILVLIFSWIITLYYVLWLMLGNREHFDHLRNIISLLKQIFEMLIAIVIVSMIETADWSKKSMRRSVAYIVVPICYFGYRAFANQSHDNILTNGNIPMWLIAIANMMVVVHVMRDQSHDNILIQHNKPMWLMALTNMMVVIIGNQSHDYILNKPMWLIALANMMVVIHVIYNHQPSFYFYGTNNVVGGRPWHRVALKSNMGAAAATLTNKGVEILAAAIDSSLTGGVATSANQSLRLLLDSGASSHVVGDKSMLQGYRELANPRTGTQPDGSTVRMIGVGTIQTEHFTITDVYHVEGLSVNLISVSQLYRQYGMGFWFLHGRCGIMLADATTAGGGYLDIDNDRLYVLTSLHVPSGPVQG